ncbi:hypothetical protein J437_LFUL004867 [Ladona fulva]|uniref:Uncharacterized protein n=1 Tax=Ladona fulva TaxID=123851 RepID=A0A8K0NUH5_LADFU|nr:hypothetical protein J437_LFUL004867 [Ladona fulva]
MVIRPYYLPIHRHHRPYSAILRLKTVMERGERYAGDLYDSRRLLTLGNPSPPGPTSSGDSPPPPSSPPSYPFPLPRLDREGKSIGDSEYAVPSPPERDSGGWTNRCGTRLTQADLEEYARTYEESLVLRQHQMMALQQSQHAAAAAAHMMLLTSLGGHHNHSMHHGMVPPHHAVGGGGASSASSSSYAHSEGYHSYVSSCDSSASHTPFLDRLRRESEAAAANQRMTMSSGSECGGCKSTTEGQGADEETDDAGVAEEDEEEHHESSDSMCDEGSNGSRVTHTGDSGGSGGSSSGGETLKWHGSVGDVSVASSSVSGSSSAAAAAARQLIAHSARVKTPQRHHSESVLYLGGNSSTCGGGGSASSSTSSWQSRVQRNNALNHKLRMFPVNTYTVQPQQQQPLQQSQQPTSPSSPPPDQTSPRTMLRLPHSFSVAERIHELEKQTRRRADGNWSSNGASTNGGGYTYLDPEKRHRVSDPTLKAIQKKALLSYYERHHRGGGRCATGNPVPETGVVGVARLTCVPGMPPSGNAEDGLTKHTEGNGVIGSNGTWRSEQQQAQPQVPTQSHHQQMSPNHSNSHQQYSPQSPRQSTSYQQKGTQEQNQSYHRSQSMDGRPSPPTEPPPSEDDPHSSIPQVRMVPQNSAPLPYSRRSSSASDYLSSGGTWREHFQPPSDMDIASSLCFIISSASCGSLPGGELGPLILGPPISLDHWVPERPPKKPHLRAAFSPTYQLQSAPHSFTHLTNEISDTPPSSPPIPPPRTTSSASSPASPPSSLLTHRCPSPDDPPPPPPPPLPEGDDELVLSDEPLPPPPPHLQPPSPHTESWSGSLNKRSSTSSRLSTDTQPENGGRTNGTYQGMQYSIPERHFFGENFNPNPSAKPGSPPPRPQQLQPWQPMIMVESGGSPGHSTHSQSSNTSSSPNVPMMGVPAIRTLVKSPNQGFATSKSVSGSGRDRPPVMARARACTPQHWRSADLSSESTASTQSPSPSALHDSNAHCGSLSPPVKEGSSEWPSAGSQAHRRPNHWQVPLKSTGRKYQSDYPSPTKTSPESGQVKSPNRACSQIGTSKSSVQNSDEDNRHGHARENGVGDVLIGERVVEGIEDNGDANNGKMKSGKFQANSTGKAVLSELYLCFSVEVEMRLRKVQGIVRKLFLPP